MRMKTDVQWWKYGVTSRQIVDSYICTTHAYIDFLLQITFLQQFAKLLRLIVFVSNSIEEKIVFSQTFGLRS